MTNIQSRIDAVFSQQERSQFGSNRYALFFKPGKYDLDVQVQILNERDDCCFGVAQHKTPATYKADVEAYERRVQQKLERLGAGTFKLEVDSIAPNHMISGYASANLILHELNLNNRRNGGKL